MREERKLFLGGEYGPSKLCCSSKLVVGLWFYIASSLGTGYIDANKTRVSACYPAILQRVPYLLYRIEFINVYIYCRYIYNLLVYE